MHLRRLSIPLALAGLAPIALSNDAPIVLSPMHGPLASFGAATTSDAIYVLGGHVGGAHQHSRENLSAKLVRYPLNDLSSFEELPGGVGLQSVSLVSRDDELYRVGGMRALNAPGAEDDLHSVDTFARYLPDTGAWASVHPLPAARSSHDSIFIGSTLYVFGGWRLNGETQEWYDQGASIDLSSADPEWLAIAQPFERRALAVAAAYGRLYAIGGLTPDGETSSRVDIYDPQANTWSQAPDLPISGFGATAFGTQEGLFFFGRGGNLWHLGDGAQEWKQMRSSAIPRFFARLVPAGAGKLAVIGGASPQGRPALLEVLATTTQAPPAPIVSSLSLRSPIGTRQRQGAFIHDNRLYLFGGNRYAEAHRFDPADFSDEGWSLDLLSGEWRSEKPLPAPRQSLRSAMLGDSSTAILAGGFGPGADGNRSWPEVHLFDLTTRTWRDAPVELPWALTQFGWFADDSALWSVGGVAYDSAADGNFAPGEALYRWEIGNEKGFVNAGAVLKHKRRAFASTRIGRSLFIVGGMNPDFDSVETPERIDLDTQEVVAMSQPPRHRLGGHAVTLGDKLYVTGGTVTGSEGRGFDRSLDCYDPLTDEWSTLVHELPVPATHLRLAVWGERLVAFSTAREGHIDFAFVTPAGLRPADGGFGHP